MHVNADCPEDVVRCINMAVEWRQEFSRDVVVDLVRLQATHVISHSRAHRTAQS